MTLFEHTTPRPWVEDDGDILDADRKSVLFFCDDYDTEEGQANLALVVRAVNCFDHLVAALRLVADDPGLTAAATAAVRDALNRAEGK